MQMLEGFNDQRPGPQGVSFRDTQHRPPRSGPCLFADCFPQLRQVLGILDECLTKLKANGAIQLCAFPSNVLPRVFTADLFAKSADRGTLRCCNVPLRRRADDLSRTPLLLLFDQVNQDTSAFFTILLTTASAGDVCGRTMCLLPVPAHVSVFPMRCSA